MLDSLLMSALLVLDFNFAEVADASKTVMQPPLLLQIDQEPCASKTNHVTYYCLLNTIRVIHDKLCVSIYKQTTRPSMCIISRLDVNNK
jgi:hypothetical protein